MKTTQTQSKSTRHGLVPCDQEKCSLPAIMSLLKFGFSVSGSGGGSGKGGVSEKRSKQENDQVYDRSKRVRRFLPEWQDSVVCRSFSLTVLTYIQ